MGGGDDGEGDAENEGEKSNPYGTHGLNGAQRFDGEEVKEEFYKGC